MGKFKRGDKVQVTNGYFQPYFVDNAKLVVVEKEDSGYNLKPETEDELTESGKEVPRYVNSGHIWVASDHIKRRAALPQIEPVKDTRTDMEITIDNLRELARHAEKWDKARFDMRQYRMKGDELLEYKDVEKEEPDCGTSCCMIGIGQAKGMGKDLDADTWIDYVKALFPALRMATHTKAFCKLFGPNLESKLKRRVKGLRLAANMLEMKGEIDYSKLPD